MSNESPALLRVRGCLICGLIGRSCPHVGVGGGHESTLIVPIAPRVGLAIINTAPSITIPISPTTGQPVIW